VRFTEHAGALYGSVEHEGGVHDRFLRLTQRLDGFVSLDAGPDGGIAVTKPLTFLGSRLTVNVAAKGSLRIGLLDASGQPIPGYESAELTGDAVSLDVKWTSAPSAFEGKTVPLRFELRDAKLFAFPFVR
jgi:hypothetical protein